MSDRADSTLEDTDATDSLWEESDSDAELAEPVMLEAAVPSAPVADRTRVSCARARPARARMVVV